MVETPARVKLRRKSRCGVSCSVRSSRSVTCFMRFFDGGAGPCGLHHHGLDDEGRVLAAAQPVVGGKPRQHRDDHQVDGDRTVLQRPFGEIEAAGLPRSWLASEQPDLLARCSACTPAVTTMSPASGRSPTATRYSPMALDLDRPQRHGQGCGIDHPDRRLLVGCASARSPGSRSPALRPSACVPFTVAPRRIASGGFSRLTLTSKVRVTGSACGATSRTWPRTVTLGSRRATR